MLLLFDYHYPMNTTDQLNEFIILLVDDRPENLAAFLEALEARSGRSLAPGKRGRKPKVI